MFVTGGSSPTLRHREGIGAGEWGAEKKCRMYQIELSARKLVLIMPVKSFAS